MPMPNKQLIAGYHYTDESILPQATREFIIKHLRATMPLVAISDDELFNACLADQKENESLLYFEEDSEHWDNANPDNLGEIVAKRAIASLHDAAINFFDPQPCEIS